MRVPRLTENPGVSDMKVKEGMITRSLTERTIDTFTQVDLQGIWNRWVVQVTIVNQQVPLFRSMVTGDLTE